MKTQEITSDPEAYYNELERQHNEFLNATLEENDEPIDEFEETYWGYRELKYGIK